MKQIIAALAGFFICINLQASEAENKQKMSGKLIDFLNEYEFDSKNINAMNMEGIAAGKTPLTFADAIKRLDIVDELIKHGAKIDIQSLKKTLIIDAIDQGFPNVAEALIKHGAALDAQDTYEQTALMRACVWGHSKIAELLITKGAQLDIQDSSGRTALMIAVKNANLIIVQKLIQHGALLDKRDDDGVTALMLAVNRNNVSIVEELLRNGADYTLVSTRGHGFYDSYINKGSTAISIAKRNGFNAIVKKLESHPAKIGTIVSNELGNEPYRLPNGIVGIINGYLG